MTDHPHVSQSGSDESIDGLAERFLEAIREQKHAVAAGLLHEHPLVGWVNIFTAAAAGLTDRVGVLIHDDPAQVVATHSNQEWPPLAYACASTVHRSSEGHARDARRVATALLDAGAGPNSFTIFNDGGQRAPISVLYHACMSDHPALVDLLLERGANTQDGESIYHAAQHNRRACLESLLDHGADLSSTQQPYGNTPLYFLVGHHDDDGGDAAWFQGLIWLLEHGADPDVPSGKKAETPLHGLAASQPKLATTKALLAHGADVNLPRGDGRTAYAIAVRHGNHAIADLLRERGAETSVLLPIEHFLGACLAADEGRARSLLAAHPALFTSMTDEDRSALRDAVAQDRADAIRLMASLGFQLGWHAAHSATALHEAAWTGKADLVRLLISLGAPINVREDQFGCSPLAWATHGSGCHPGRDDTYIAIVDALLDAGADRETSINKWGELPERAASPAVARHLKERIGL